jgi:hypothetical protein
MNSTGEQPSEHEPNERISQNHVICVLFAISLAFVYSLFVTEKKVNAITYATLQRLKCLYPDLFEKI